MTKMVKNIILGFLPLMILSGCGKSETDNCFFKENKDFVPIQYLNAVNDTFQVNKVISNADYGEEENNPQFLIDANAFVSGKLVQSEAQWNALKAQYDNIDFTFNYDETFFTNKSVVIFGRKNYFEPIAGCYLRGKSVSITDKKLTANISNMLGFTYDGMDHLAILQLYAFAFVDSEKVEVNEVQINYLYEKYYCL